VIETDGGESSITNVLEAETVFPALSVATARSVYEPSPPNDEKPHDQLVVPVAAYSCSDTLAKLEPFQYRPALLRRLTWTEAIPFVSEEVPQTSYVVAVAQPALYVPLRVDEEPLAGNVIAAVGAVVSTVQVWLAAELWFVAASTARTWNVCEAADSPGYAFGLVQLE